MFKKKAALQVLQPGTIGLRYERPRASLWIEIGEVRELP